MIDDGVIDEVIRSLKSGKEATVYLVHSGAHTRCARVLAVAQILIHRFRIPAGLAITEQLDEECIVCRRRQVARC